jgi:hypothetical protein
MCVCFACMKQHCSHPGCVFLLFLPYVFMHPSRVRVSAAGMLRPHGKCQSVILCLSRELG